MAASSSCRARSLAIFTARHRFQSRIPSNGTRITVPNTRGLDSTATALPQPADTCTALPTTMSARTG